jgi:hypothetical protein
MPDGSEQQPQEMNGTQQYQTVVTSLYEVIYGYAEEKRAKQRPQHFKGKQYISKPKPVPMLVH